MTKNPLHLFVGLTLSLFAVVSILPAGVPIGVPSARAAETATIELGVEGMTCPSCTFAVKAALKKVDGVENAEVSFRDKKAVVTYDPDRAGPEALVEAVDKTGFHAVLPTPAER